MADQTETIRRELVAEINAAPGSREALEAEHGQVWDTDQMMEDFEAIGFGAPQTALKAACSSSTALASTSTSVLFRPHQ